MIPTDFMFILYFTFSFNFFHHFCCTILLYRLFLPKWKKRWDEMKEKAQKCSNVLSLNVIKFILFYFFLIININIFIYVYIHTYILHTYIYKYNFLCANIKYIMKKEKKMYRMMNIVFWMLTKTKTKQNKKKT